MVVPEEVKTLAPSQNDVYQRQKSVKISYGSISGTDNKTDKDPMEFTKMERWFPSGFKHELYELYKFSWPLVLTVFLNFLIRVTGTMFSGQLGPIELDAVAMGISIANVIGTSIGIGLIAACDTLFAQSYGSVNKKQVGVYLQTAIYISTLSCVVSWALLFNTNNILLVLGQNPEVARATEEFMYYFMPALYFLFLFQLLQKYLQVQGIVIPVVIIAIGANVVNVGMQYLILNVLQWGIKGSAIGQSVSYFILAAFTLAYMLITGSHKKTWGGWSREACRDWGEFMKLGLSSIAMICLEWWTYEISAFLTGILGEVELGASSIAYQIWTIYTSLPLGISSACAFRIGRYLGEERLDAALTVTRVSFVVAVSLSVISGLVTLAIHKQLPYLFSNDHHVLASSAVARGMICQHPTDGRGFSPGICRASSTIMMTAVSYHRSGTRTSAFRAIIDLSRELLLLLALFICLGCAKIIISGIIRGTGRQVVGGVISFVAYFIFAMPIGIPLMFLTPARAAGFWWGLLVGVSIACGSLTVIVWKTNWADEAKQAQVRAKTVKKKRKKRESQSIYNPNYDETTGLLGNGTAVVGSDKSPLMADDDLALSRSITISTSFEFETSVQRRNYWRNIIIQKICLTAVCFILFAFGIICRFIIFIPPDIPRNFNFTDIPMDNWTLSSTLQTTKLVLV